MTALVVTLNHALVHGNGLGNGTVTHREEHGVAGAVRHVAGAPLLGAAKVALGNQAVGLVALGQHHFLAVDDDRVVTLAHPAPGQAPLGRPQVSPLHQAAGYATFANNGKQVTPHVVREVTDAAGQVLYRSSSAQTQTIEPDVAIDVNYALSNAPTRPHWCSS